MSGKIIYRHHVEPRVKLYSNLDVMQERRIDDYWNVDGSRDLSDPWTGFTQFTLLEEKPPDGYMWSGWRLTRKQLTSRLDHLWPGKNAKLKEKQKWSNEKLRLENARKLRGIYFIDPDAKEFKETIKNARKKLETPTAPAMPCKTSKKSQHGATRVNPFSPNQNLRESRLRMEDSLPNYHEEGAQFTATYSFGTPIYSYVSSG